MGKFAKDKKEAPVHRKPKQKLVIQFDEEARKNYLTGFSKRKNERRQKAQEQLEAQAKEARRLRRAEIKEKVKQLRALAGEADDGEDAANAGGDGADGSEPGLEQSEVQYAGEELVTTVVTTTEVTPLSFDTRAPTFEKADDEDDGDAMADAFKAEIEKKQKVQEAVYAIKALKKQPVPSVPHKDKKGKGKGHGFGHGHKGGGRHGQHGKKSGKGRGRGDDQDGPPGKGGKGGRGGVNKRGGGKHGKGSRGRR